MRILDGMARVRILAAVVFAVAVMPGGAAPQTQPQPLQAGFAEIEITPPVPYRLDGYFTERLSTGIKDPLKA